MVLSVVFWCALAFHLDLVVFVLIGAGFGVWLCGFCCGFGLMWVSLGGCDGCVILLGRFWLFCVPCRFCCLFVAVALGA